MEEVDNFTLEQAQAMLIETEKKPPRRKSAKILEAEAALARAEEEEERRGEKMSTDMKVEAISDWVVRKEVFTNIMVNEEICQSYVKIPNIDDEVAGWQSLPRKGVETIILGLLKKGKLGGLPCVLPAVAKNAKMITDTVLMADTKDVSVREKGNGITLVHPLGEDGSGLYMTWDKGLVSGSELEGAGSGGRVGGVGSVGSVGSVGGGRYCFRRFFHNSPVEEEVRGLLENTEGEWVERVEEIAETAYKQGLEWLKSGGTEDGKYGVRFEDTLWLWANKNKGVYMDILTMSCMPLIKKKAEKAFFIMGPAANGKSMYRELLRRVYGAGNCSAVQMGQIGDWSYAGTLDNMMLNFPDEEKTKVEDFDSAAFKTMATHGDMVVRRKGSSFPLPLKCDFVSISPINGSINWDNIDGGVASRVQIVPFSHDFSSERSGGVGSDWADRKFTGKFCLEVLGELMGLARAYNEWGESDESQKKGIWHWSDSSVAMSETWVAENKNVRRFMDEFGPVYVGYQSLSLLYQAYHNWVDSVNMEEGTDMAYESGGRRALKDMCTFMGYLETSKDSRSGSKVVVRQGEKRPIAGESLCSANSILIDGRLVGGTGLVSRSIGELLELGIDVVRAKKRGQKLDNKEIIDTVQTLWNSGNK